MSLRELTPDYLGAIRGAALVALSQGTTSTPQTLESIQKKLTTVNYVWNPVSLAYDVMTQPASSTGGAGSTTVDANLSSAGSTKLVGIVQVSNPTTSVNVANPTTSVSLSAGSSSNMVGAVAVSNPTTSVTISNPTTAVNVANQPTVDLSSVGSTRLVGRVEVNTPTTLVTVSSGVVLGAGSSANTIGSVANVAGSSATLIGAVAVSSGVVLGAGSSANVLGSVSLVAGTSANTVGSVALVAGTSANTLGSVALVAGSSANILGQVVQGPGSSANFWFVQSIAFSSGNVARSSVSTTVDIQLIAANASRKALVIANRSTTQTVGIGYSTAITTTALANVDLFLNPAAQLIFGLGGGLPLYLGPMRGINLTSTTVAGSVAVIEFT